MKTRVLFIQAINEHCFDLDEQCFVEIFVLPVLVKQPWQLGRLMRDELPPAAFSQCSMEYQLQPANEESTAALHRVLETRG
jgi:hypothetical protein